MITEVDADMIAKLSDKPNSPVVGVIKNFAKLLELQEQKTDTMHEMSRVLTMRFLWPGSSEKESFRCDVVYKKLRVMFRIVNGKDEEMYFDPMDIPRFLLFEALDRPNQISYMSKLKLKNRYNKAYEKKLSV